MKDLELAALMCSRVCHDLISPVGALANGVELLAEDIDEGMRAEALQMIGSSAAKASAKLQFARLAYGAAAGHASMIDLSDAEYVVRELFKSMKVSLDWRLPQRTLAKDHVKLLLNLILVASEATPRGGVIIVELVGDSEEHIRVAARGEGARLREDVAQMLIGESVEEILDPRSVQPYVAGLLARELGLDMHASADEGQVVFEARKPA